MTPSDHVGADTALNLTQPVITNERTGALGILIYREGNVFRLKAHLADVFVWEVGILARAEDKGTLQVAKGEVSDDPTPDFPGGRRAEIESFFEEMETGRLYWLFEVSHTPSDLPMELIRISEAGGRLTATTAELYQELEAQIKTLDREGVSAADGEFISLTPKGLELVRGALLPPGMEELKTKGRRLPAIPDIFKDGLLPITVNHATWAMLKAVHDSQDGRITAKWTDSDGETFPTHRTTFRKGRSAVDVSVRDGAGDGAPSAAALAAQWDKVHTMGDKAHLTSDVLLVCLAHWAAHRDGPRTPVTITVDAILDARQIKRKKHSGEPANWQHGHRQEDRLDVARSLAHLESLWLEIRDVELIPEGKPDKSGRRRAGQHATFSSRALVILDKAHAVDFEGEAIFLAASIMPGKWAEEYWQRGLKYTGHLAAKALHYDPYRRAPEKGLAKYFAFNFAFDRTGKADTLPRRVETLLEDAAISQDSRHPERTKKRFEKAMDLLVKDGIIEAWEYQAGRPFLNPQGWLKTWLGWTVKTTPPENLGARPTFGARGESSQGQWRPLELAPFDD